MKMSKTMEKLNMNASELLYPISMNYGKKDWDVVAAIREFLSNMLDTKSDYSFEYKDGIGYMRDTGKGLTKKDFIFGESTRDNSQIGQFGEGMKMALITMLRNNRKVEITTVGFTVLVEKVYSKEYDSEVMLLSFKDNDVQTGTTIQAECTQTEFQTAVDLFLELRQDIEQMDKSIYLPAGDVYIMGLKTTSIPNMLFSYNILDKTMTNRDRNIVATDKLQHNLVTILENMKNIKAIRVYLENFETNPTAYEYQLRLYPRHKEQWKKALDKIYKDGKYALSSDLQSDLNATAMGYKVFRNIPYHVTNILRELDIPYSNEIARNYQGEGLFDKEKIVYPISVDYCSNWTIQDALREFIANALDTDTEIRVEYKDSKGRIVDSGDGIRLKHFIFGISEKGKENIGQFGEGLKVASLVMARNHRKVEIQTAGYNYYPTIEHSDEFDTDLFTVYFKKNQRKSGTVITFECTEKELDKTKELFSYFRDGRKKSLYTKHLDIFFDEPGNIYVNGLLTAHMECIFGYNIKDKTLVASRDRNSVDTIRLTRYIEDFLRTTDDESVIIEYLTGWKRDRYYFEYNTSFMPEHMSVWEKMAKNLFKQSCLESYEPEHNFIAKQAGYELLKNVPGSVSTILSRIKVKTAEAIAKKYKNKGIIFEDKVVYPISVNYARNWTVKDAIRELIANALDTDTRVSIGVKDNEGYIIDRGNGIEKKHLLFGNSNKDDNQIGQFGEGLKMASLVLARNGRNMRLVTKGFEYRAKIERDVEFDSDVLVLYLKKSKKRKGTDIYFDCSEQEMKDTQNLFLEFNKNFKQLDNGIFSPGGYIFVNGVMIERIDALYSYNLTDAKKCLSRDRKSINIDAARQEISVIVGMCRNEQFITDFLKDRNHYHFEQNLNVHITSISKDEWKKVMKKVFPKHCIPTYVEYDLAAVDKGYTLLGHLTPTQNQILTQLGMPYSNEVATLRGDEKIVKKRCSVKDLNEVGKKRWRAAIRKYKKLYGKEIAEKVEIVEEFNYNEVARGTLGYYNDRNDTVYILKDVIEKEYLYTFATLMGVLIHEHIHRISGAPDRTREFENALSDELGRISELFV